MDEKISTHFFGDECPGGHWTCWCGLFNADYICDLHLEEAQEMKEQNEDG